MDKTICDIRFTNLRGIYFGNAMNRDREGESSPEGIGLQSICHFL